jgi:hypothetical protein
MVFGVGNVFHTFFLFYSGQHACLPYKRLKPDFVRKILKKV